MKEETWRRFRTWLQEGIEAHAAMMRGVHEAPPRPSDDAPLLERFRWVTRNSCDMWDGCGCLTSITNHEIETLILALGAQPPADSPLNGIEGFAGVPRRLRPSNIPLGASRSTPAPPKTQRWNVVCPMEGRHAVATSPCSWCDGFGFVSIYLARDIDRGSEGAVPAPAQVDGFETLRRALEIERSYSARLKKELEPYLCPLCRGTGDDGDEGGSGPCGRCNGAGLLKLPVAAAVPPGAAEARPLPQVVKHRADFCEQVNLDGIMPSRAWFMDTATLLREVDWVAPAGPRAVPQTRLEMLRWHLAEVQRLGGSPRALAAIGDAIADEIAGPRDEKESK